MRKSKKPFEVRAEMAHAKKDLLTVQALLHAVNSGTISEGQGLYLNQLYPNPEPPKFQFWRTRLEMEEERIQGYLEDATAALKIMEDPRRSLPKKKQRELGLLPPV